MLSLCHETALSKLKFVCLSLPLLYIILVKVILVFAEVRVVCVEFLHLLQLAIGSLSQVFDLLLKLLIVSQLASYHILQSILVRILALCRLDHHHGLLLTDFLGSLVQINSTCGDGSVQGYFLCFKHVLFLFFHEFEVFLAVFVRFCAAVQLVFLDAIQVDLHLLPTGPLMREHLEPS